jgi:hypothetical protein
MEGVFMKIEMATATKNNTIFSFVTELPAVPGDDVG